MNRSGNERHRLSGTSEHMIWRCMKNRCYNPNYHRFDLYGGRGIKVCDEWLHSFTTFLDYIGLRPSKQHSIDRWPNKDGNYEPGNVRWATWKEQANNKNPPKASGRPRKQRSLNSDALVHKARANGISYVTLQGRLRRGWSIERAIMEPASSKFRNNQAKNISSREGD